MFIPSSGASLRSAGFLLSLLAAVVQAMGADNTAAVTLTGWRDAATKLKLAYAYADTNLTGNGLQEKRLLENNFACIYTKPDITESQSRFLNLAGTHSVSDSLLLSGNLYYRKIKTQTLNGDINEDSLSSDLYGAGETTADTPFPSSS